ncbi:hypothetical protein DMENIID0001_105020 [Sergentomyia squamirostris]
MFLKQCLDEIAQKEDGLLGIVMEILKSRRLLMDHQEILEDLLQSPHCNPPKSSIFSFNKSMGIFLGSIGISETLKWLGIHSKLIILPPLVASGYCFLASIKELRDLRNRRKIAKIHQLIEELNNFDTFLRKQMIFLKEMSMFRNKIKRSGDWEASITLKAIKSVRKVTEVIYQQVLELDKTSEIPQKYQGIYQPLDNLEDCDYFRRNEEEFEGKHLKEFFNIFLYIQSQFLLKISLIICSGDDGFSACEKDITIVCTTIRRELKENSENLDYFLQPTSMETTRFSTDASRESSGHIQQFVGMKSTSGTIVTKLLTLVTRLRLFDGDLQAISGKDEVLVRKELLKMRESFEDLQESFTCINLEFENLHLIYNKILNLPENAKNLKISEKECDEKVDEKIEDLSANPARDEFFHLDTSNMAEWEKREDFNLADYEYDRVNQKLIKSTFKPVLVQLRKRIHPLHDAMKERERKFMESQGKNLPEDADDSTDSLNDEEDPTDSLDERSSTGSLSDDDLMSFRKRRPRPQKYEENREFLQEKHQIGLFSTLPPPKNILPEDILE